MAAREVAVKKYVVRLSAEERERLEALRTKGKIPARRLRITGANGSFRYQQWMYGPYAAIKYSF